MSETDIVLPMDERQCLEAINSGEWTASELLREADPKLVTRFKRLDKSLQDFLAEARKSFPDAQYYTAGGGFCLLLGGSHDAHEHSQQQLSAIGGGAQIGDGDW